MERSARPNVYQMREIISSPNRIEYAIVEKAVRDHEVRGGHRRRLSESRSEALGRRTTVPYTALETPGRVAGLVKRWVYCTSVRSTSMSVEEGRSVVKVLVLGRSLRKQTKTAGSGRDRGRDHIES